MTAAQYAALTQVMGPPTGKEEQTEKQSAQRPVMAVRRKQGYVRNCLDKLRPDSRSEVFRSIRAMFHGSGGLRDTEIDQMIDSLVKDAYFSIDASGKVHYSDEKARGLSVLKEQNCREVKSDANTKEGGVGTKDENTLEDTFSPALLTEGAESNDSIDGEAEVEPFHKVAHG